MRVLVATASTADDRKTLAAVRSLGRAGVHVTVGGDFLRAAPFRSRHCRARVRYPNPAQDVDRFTSALLELVATGHYDVLLPLCDYTTVPVALRKHEFEQHVRLAVPDGETLMRAHDKERLLETARRLGIDIPETFAPSDVDGVRAAAQRLSFPCVMKSRRGAGGEGVSFPESREELERLWCARGAGRDAVFDETRPLIQQRVPGEIHDVCLLFRDGEPRAALTQRRVRMFPGRGGVGVLNETTDEPVLREKAIALLRALHWHGPAQVEFRVDADRDRAVLMEVNSRFWGTLDLSIQAGVDFPLLAYRMAAEGDVAPVFDYEVGLRYRWPFPYTLLVGRETGRWRQTLREFVWPAARTRSDLRLTDPFPHLVRAVGWRG